MRSLKIRIVLPVSFLAVSVALALIFLLPTIAVGQGEGIHVVSQEVQSDFPNSVTFKLTASGPDPIEEVRVFLKPVGSDRSTYGYLDLEPGVLVSGEYVMPTGTGATHRPPGTVIRYYYEIRDKAGRVLNTEEADYLYMDNALEWKEMSSPDGLLNVYYYGAFVETRAKAVLEAAQQTVEHMEPVLGIRPEEPINIVAYSNYRDMSRALPFRAQAVREELVTEGQAWPSQRVVLVLTAESDFTGVASHEMTHVLLSDAAGMGYSKLPMWLNEGLAEFGNVDPGVTYDRALAYAVYTRRLKPLWYLTQFTGEPEEIIIAYGQGSSAVRYLIGAYGEEKMRELMSAFREVLPADQALQQVYGFDQFGLDSEWRRALGLVPLPSPEAVSSEITPATGQPPVAEADVTPVPTPLPQETPAPAEEAAIDRPAVSDEERRSPRSCGAPSDGSANSPSDIAVWALLIGPLFALNARWGLSKTRRLLAPRMFHQLRRGLGKVRRARSG